MGSVIPHRGWTVTGLSASTMGLMLLSSFWLSESIQPFPFVSFFFLNCPTKQAAETVRLDLMGKSCDLNCLPHPVWSNSKVRGWCGWRGHLHCLWRRSDLIYSGGECCAGRPSNCQWLKGKVFYDHFFNDLWKKHCSISGVTRSRFRPLWLFCRGADQCNYTVMTWSLRDLFFTAFHVRGLGWGDAARGLDWSYSQKPFNRIRLHNLQPQNVGVSQNYATLMLF